MKTSVRRSIVIVVILLLSVAAGFLYQLIWDKIDRVRYPRRYNEYVAQYSSDYGVPEYIVYAVIQVESGYSSNAVSDAGAIGLMQMTPDTFAWVSMLMKRSADAGMLYDPRTNIEYGTYLLSYLYIRYNRWDTALAAYNAGMARVDDWLLNSDYSEDGINLTSIPIDETRQYVRKVNEAIRVYQRLYYAET